MPALYLGHAAPPLVDDELLTSQLASLACGLPDAVMAALEPAGWFVIWDVPFPEDDEGLRQLPGRVMSRIQFFEAQIDDQLLPATTTTISSLATGTTTSGRWS